MTVARVDRSRFRGCELQSANRRRLFAHKFAHSLDRFSRLDFNPRVRRPVSVGGPRVCFGFKTRPTGRQPLRRILLFPSLGLRLPFLPHLSPFVPPPARHDSFPSCLARVALRLREPISVNLRYELISLALRDPHNRTWENARFCGMQGRR